MRDARPTTTLTSPPATAAAVVKADLDYICGAVRDELAQLAGRRLLIAGGAGFLGYYLVQTPLHWNRAVEPKRRIKVTVYDNYIRGVPDWLKALDGHADLALVRHDMTAPLLDDVGEFDCIVHAASIASPTYYRKYPIETMDANVTGLRNLLDYFRRRRDAGRDADSLLFFSSSEIYGDPLPGNIPTPETYRGNVSCTGPRACYDESKRYGEALCVNFARQYGLPVKVARPFNNYGPGLKITDRRVVPDFARDILAGRDVAILSDGSPTRTFCYVADAVVGYYKVLTRGRAGEAYNVGVESPEVSVAELAERLVDIARDVLGYRGRVVRQASADHDYLIDNPSRRCPVIAKARIELGYEPTITLDDGLRRLLVWYTEHSEAEDA